MAKTKFVVGFYFDMFQKKPSVLLIKKKRPQWQAGLYNGIGGHIEEGETPLQAMIREFKEETDVHEENWIHKITINSPKWILHVFAVIQGDSKKPKTMTDEELRFVPVQELYSMPLVYNITWLVPIMLDATIVKPFSFECELYGE